VAGRPRPSRRRLTVPDSPMQAYYAQGGELTRLDSFKGLLEWERTKEILGRVLPPPPAVIADVGGGPGRYALWLAASGYTVEHRDIVQMHVEQAQATNVPAVHSAVGDARALDLGDASVDAVLLLGPLYHLADRDQRVRALSEARRVVRPGGPVVIAVISRWAPRLDGVVTERLYETAPALLGLLDEVERSGQLSPLAKGSFTCYTHRPAELAGEIADAHLRLEDLVGVEGLPIAEAELGARLADPTARQVVLDAARAIERVPELLGLSSHLIATARSVPDEPNEARRTHAPSHE